MRTLFVLAILLVLLLGLSWACGPFFPVAVFTFHKHPDFPRTRFLGGQLGILEPTYARSYLVVAYRYLKGTGLSAGEREQVRLYWTDRESGDWDDTLIDTAALWEKTRDSALGLKAPERKSAAATDPYQFQKDRYFWRTNCADDAFATATATLRQRIAQHGQTNQFVRDWIDAQDAVFRDCGESANSLPEAAPSDAPQWLQKDRAYQLAAAHFYAGRLRDAEAEFDQISSDPSSPWRWIAPYLVLRSEARAAQTGVGGPLKTEDAAFRRMEAQVKRILADTKLAPIHGMTKSLFRRVRQHLHPQIELRELAAAVAAPHAEGSLRQDLWDYTTLLNYFLYEALYQPDNNQNAEFDKEIATLPRQDDITDWIVNFQSAAPDDKQHALHRWQSTHSLPWLVAAMSHSSGKDQSAAALIEESGKIPQQSPAFWMAAFHRNRLRIEAGQKDEARQELDSLLDEHKTSLPGSVGNHFRALRMLAAPDLSGFLMFSMRHPVLITDSSDSREIGPEYPENHRRLDRWDRDSIKVLNERAPLELWKDAAANTDLPPHMHQEMALAAFARAVLLNEDQALQVLAPIVAQSLPEAQKFMQRVEHDATPDERHFAGVFFLLHYANLRPHLTSGVSWHVPTSPSMEQSPMDAYVNSWWCALDSGYELDWDATRFFQYGRDPHIDSDMAASQAAFLQPSDIAAGKAEFQRLAATGNAPDYLTTETLAWARIHAADVRVPEALAFAVRTGKYGCTGPNSARLNQQAFALLHSAYGRTTWAAQTPFWYRTWLPRIPQ